MEVRGPEKGGAETASRRSLCGADQVSIAVLCHPLRAGEMRVMNLAAPVRFTCRIKAKEYLDGFAPISSVARGIEQAQIENHMLAVIGREGLADRGRVEKRRHRRFHQATIFARKAFVNTGARHYCDNVRWTVRATRSRRR